MSLLLPTSVLAGLIPGSNSPTPVGGSNISPNQAITAAPNTGVFWTANHDARLLEANSLGLKPDDILGLMILYNMRTSEGREFLSSIFKSYMATVTAAIGHLAQASQANMISAYVNPLIIADILERNYMIQAALCL